MHHIGKSHRRDVIEQLIPIEVGVCGVVVGIAMQVHHNVSFAGCKRRDDVKSPG